MNVAEVAYKILEGTELLRISNNYRRLSTDIGLLIPLKQEHRHCLYN